MKIMPPYILAFGICSVLLTPGIQAVPNPDCVTVWLVQDGWYISVVNYPNYHLNGTMDHTTALKGQTREAPVKKGTSIYITKTTSSGVRLPINGQDSVIANTDLRITCSGQSDAIDKKPRDNACKMDILESHETETYRKK